MRTGLEARRAMLVLKKPIGSHMAAAGVHRQEGIGMSNSGESVAGRIAASSRDALAALSITARKTMGDRIHDVVAQACRAGEKDVSMREIQLRLNQSTGVYMDMSSISARVNALVCANRLVRDKEHTRPCSVTGKQIEPLSVPPVQARLCA